MTLSFAHSDNQHTRHTRGFTLIELLVVISIIGLLSSIVLASLNTARAKARDAALLEGTHQLMLALELYYNQYAQFPPSTPQNYCGDEPYCNYTSIEGSSTADPALLTDLQPYMSSLPNPNTFKNSDKGGNTTSRLMYRVLTNAADMPNGCSATAANCFVLAVYPETSSGPIYYISNGEIRYSLDTNLY
ncbi:MAG: type II secretion system protein [Minisyncoccota bacterium]